MAGQNQKPSGKRRGKPTKHTTVNVDDTTVDAATRRARSLDARAILRVIRERDAKLYRAFLVVIGEAGRAREILPSLMVIVDFVINQARREAFGLDAAPGSDAAPGAKRSERSRGAR